MALRKMMVYQHRCCHLQTAHEYDAFVMAELMVIMHRRLAPMMHVMDDDSNGTAMNGRQSRVALTIGREMQVLFSFYFVL